MPETPARPCEDPAPRIYTPSEVFCNNLPYAAMLLLGAAVFVAGSGAADWGWIAGTGYVLAGLGGSLWIILFLCPHCHLYGGMACPCGYGIVAARLRARAERGRFPEQFRRHIPVIVPLWFIPPGAGAWMLARAWSWTLAGLLAIFVLDAFVVLPLAAKQHGCGDCPQRDDCPWMGRRAGAKTT